MTQESTYVAGKGFVDPRTGKPIGYYDPETGTAAIGVGNAPLDCIITPCMTLDEFIENLIRVRNDRNGDGKATVVMPDLLPVTAIFNKCDHIISDLDPDEE